MQVTRQLVEKSGEDRLQNDSFVRQKGGKTGRVEVDTVSSTVVDLTILVV